jgi:hypothetical protein
VTTAKRWTGYLIALAVGAFSADAAAQLMYLSDGRTPAMRVIQTDIDGDITTAFGGYAEDAAAGTGDNGVQILGVRNAACGTSSAGANGDYASVNQDANGNLCVSIAANSVGSTTDTDDGTIAAAQASVALTAGLDYVFDGTNWTRRQGFHLVDDAAYTPASDGVAVIGGTADESSTDTVSEGDAGATRITLDRKLITSPYPHTAGGLTIFRSIDLDETEEEIKATAGQLYSVWFSNMATATRFLKCYNATAANVSVGTTTPVITIALPGNSSDDISGALTGGGYGLAFDTAITCAATTGIADNDTGAPAANDVILVAGYK